MFTCAWQTLDDFSKDPRQGLMAKMGMIAVLHTWTQKLLYHPHIHCIIPAGGIDEDGRWKTSKSKSNFLFHGTALAQTVRGKLMEQLLLLYKQKQLTLEGKINHLKHYYNFWKLKKKLYETNWVVHTEEPFKNPDSVIEYLARYTHKIAISNYRIKAIEDDEITFTYLDRADKNKKEIMRLPADKFISRFLMHVLPRGFCKIRHYGFLSTRIKQQCLAKISVNLKMKEQGSKPKLTVKDVLSITKSIDPDLCPECKQGIMVCIQELPRLRGSPNYSLCS